MAMNDEWMNEWTIFSCPESASNIVKSAESLLCIFGIKEKKGPIVPKISDVLDNTQKDDF